MDIVSLLRERILREGPITFASFMETALYHPGLGYYTSEDADIGVKGDYYTSPHLHPLFGAMLGCQMEECWEIMGRPPEFHIIEMGGGRGYLAKDMLDYLAGRDIQSALIYTIIELNPRMMERQKALLGEHLSALRWGTVGSLAAARGCILSNELLDALSVHLIVMESEPKEIYVGLKNGAFVEMAGPLSTVRLGDYIREFNLLKLPPGYRTEINLAMKDRLSDACGIFKEEGFILTIDYGYSARDYYSEERTTGTLLCYHRHRTSENPYENIGRQDITAHVNFTALKRWGEELGLKALGYCRQGTYLASMGIAEKIAEIPRMEPLEMEKIKNLLMPGTIGDTHKVMVQYKGTRKLPELKGFGISNKLNTL